jgi:hypothetical protein
MPSDLSGEFGPLDPGLEEYLQILAAGPEAAELAGEQGALTMFQLNRQPLANSTQPLAVEPGWPLPAAAAQAGPPEAGAPEGGAHWAGRSGSDGEGRDARKAARAAARWRVRLAAAAAVVLVGGFAGAAYASALPAPVQHLAHVALAFAGVPDSQRAGGKRAQHTPPSAHHPPVPGATPTGPAPLPTQPGTSASPGSAATSPDVLAATTPASLIAAGTQAAVDGTLRAGGHAVAGAHVTLFERPADRLGWQLVAAATTNNQGNVALVVSALDTNAVFRLTGPGGAVSLPVRIRVTPSVTVALDAGSRGLADILVVTAQYANRGDAVVLQVQRGGTWQPVRTQRLAASLKTGFGFKTANFENDALRVVLLATSRHAAAVSNAVTVPAPG